MKLSPAFFMAGVVLLLVTPRWAWANRAWHVEIEGCYAIPTSDNLESYTASWGGGASLLYQLGQNASLGGTLIYASLPSRDGDGSVSYLSIAPSLRLVAIRQSPFVLAATISPGITTRTIRFSQEAQSNNELIPESDVHTGFGASVGVVLLYRLGKGASSIISAARCNFAPEVLASSVFGTFSLGFGYGFGDAD